MTQLKIKPTLKDTLTTSQLNTWKNNFFSSDAYSKALLIIVKSLESITPVDFEYEIRDSGYNGFILYDNKNFNRGYLIKIATTKYKNLINNNNIKFFLQNGALSYSLYEVKTVELISLIPSEIDGVYLNLSLQDELFQNIFTIILQDFSN
jgi:hypothetical protein